ncbi:MAG TPA: DMT family protein [Tepidisphaeraceae bacterium]|nr:DMT family protein [Tepidisphaeraceae bacterium]
MVTIVLLILSNVFMTIAWYGHLKHKDAMIWKAILISWLIAFFEYCLQVPANRIGSNQGFTATQLKIIQEGITLVVFIVFVKLYFESEPFKWNYALGFALMFAAVFVVNYKW